MKFKKEIKVDAIQWDGNNLGEIIFFINDKLPEFDDICTCIKSWPSLTLIASHAYEGPGTIVKIVDLNLRTYGRWIYIENGELKSASNEEFKDEYASI